MNNIVITGNLGQDVQLDKTQNGTNRATIRIADKGFNDNPNWWTGYAYGKTADYLYQYAKKGDFVIVVGRVDFNETEKDGNKITYTNLHIERVEVKSKNKSSTELIEDIE